MTTIAVRSNPVAGLTGGDGYEDTSVASLRAAAARQLSCVREPRFHRGRFCAIFAHPVAPVKRTVRARTVRAGHTHQGGSLNRDTKSVRIDFSRSLKASGGLTPSLPLAHLRQQDSCGEAPIFHVSRSFRDAPAFHEQKITGARANARKSFGEIQNV